MKGGDIFALDSELMILCFHLHPGPVRVMRNVHNNPNKIFNIFYTIINKLNADHLILKIISYVCVFNR